MDQKTRLKAYGMAVAFSVLVGFSFLGVKICVAYTDALGILTHRYNFGFLALVLLIVFRLVKLDLRAKPKKNLIITASLYLGFMVLQVIGLYFATSIEGAIIFAVIPIFAKIIASLFLKETSTLLQHVFMCLTVASLILMIVLGSSEITFDPGGTILLLLSSLAMAISNVFMRYVRTQYKPIEISAAIITGGFVLFNLATVIHGIFTGTISDYFEPVQQPEFVIATAYLGIGCILFSVQAMSYMLSKMEAAKATIFGNVSTAISIVAGVVILGEPLKLYHIVCTAVIIAGVIGISVLGERGQKDEVQNSNRE